MGGKGAGDGIEVVAEVVEVLNLEVLMVELLEVAVEVLNIEVLVVETLGWR